MKSESGSVTAEFVIVLPTVVGILLFSASLLGLQIERMRLVQRAASAANSLARGEPIEAGLVTRDGNMICVELRQVAEFGISLSDTECSRAEGQ